MRVDRTENQTSNAPTRNGLVGTRHVTWRYFQGALPGIAANLALDEALLIEAEERNAGAALRLWELDAPAVVLGASGRLREDVKTEVCAADGVPIARRSSGGGTVVIGPGALNVAVVLPASAAPGLGAVPTAHAYVLDRTAAAIRAHGLTVERLGSGDLTLQRRKFCGSAQRRLRNHFLIHATLLYQFPLGLVERYTHVPRRQPAYRENRPHAEFLVNLGLPRSLLVSALQEAWLPVEHPRRPEPVPETLITALMATKFALASWTERL